MATVRELKEALETEQTNALEIADRALSAVGTISTVSGFAIGLLGLIIAVLAIFGFGWIKSSATEAAEKVADTRLDSYIKSQEFSDRMQGAVEAEVKRRVANKFIVANITEEPDGDEPDPFPSAEEAKRT